MFEDAKRAASSLALPHVRIVLCSPKDGTTNSGRRLMVIEIPESVLDAKTEDSSSSSGNSKDKPTAGLTLTLSRRAEIEAGMDIFEPLDWSRQAASLCRVGVLAFERLRTIEAFVFHYDLRTWKLLGSHEIRSVLSNFHCAGLYSMLALQAPHRRSAVHLASAAIACRLPFRARPRDAAGDGGTAPRGQPANASGGSEVHVRSQVSRCSPK